MARIRRLVDDSRPTVYHVMSRTALDGFPLGDIEKDKLVDIITIFSKLYLVNVLGFCLMGNHFHLMVRVYPDDHFSDDEMLARINKFFKGKKRISKFQLPFYRSKLSNLSEFVKEIKQGFTRYYNKANKRWGFFWGQRFKSVFIENNEALLNCLAYIDLNPVRANIVDQLEEYRWCTLGYSVQSGNRKDLLTLELGVDRLNKLSFKEKLAAYREFVYEIGALVSGKGKSIEPEVLEKQRSKGFRINSLDCLKFRSRYFTDSAIIGSRKFVSETYLQFQDLFAHRKTKKPVPIRGLDAVYSLRRLTT